ncbi:MAG: MlaD family protein [Planctomycetota bacterium]
MAENEKGPQKDDGPGDGTAGSEELNGGHMNIPVAMTAPGEFSWSDLFQGSRMWLLTLACLALAIGIVAWSLPGKGIEITIHFPEGHGLTADDAVRFRGIDVGVVEEVKLNRELSGVDVTVNLFPFAEPLAREGTRFWIVRPELSLAGGISGLETAVGHKYIGLIPGEMNAPATTAFSGLAGSPPDAMENRGMEIILRGERRYSVTEGSPVSCRGVIVGRVLSVGLSQDGRFVDARAKIYDNHIRLVSTKTRFWASGGVDADFSLTDGLKLDVESIETLVQGGVSLLTTEDDGQPIKPGHVFNLYASPEPGWYEAANEIRVIDIELRGALPMETIWEATGVVARISGSSKNRGFVGTHIENDGEEYVLVPSDVLAIPDGAADDSFKVGIAGLEDSRIPVSFEQNPDLPLEMIQIPAASSFATPLSLDEFRSPEDKEACLAVRAAIESGEPVYLRYRIEAHDIGEEGGLLNFDGDQDVWHGAPVLSTNDGSVVGVLLVGERESRIVSPVDLLELNKGNE